MKYDYDLIIDEIIGREVAGKAAREQEEKRRNREMWRRRKASNFVWSVLYWLGVLALIAGLALVVAGHTDNFFLLLAPLIIAGALIGIFGGIGGMIAGAIACPVVVLIILFILNRSIDSDTADLVFIIIQFFLLLVGFGIVWGITLGTQRGLMVLTLITMGIGTPLIYVNRGSFGELVSYFTKALSSSAPAEYAFTTDAASENGDAKIFRVRYGKAETVICLIRTTGSHKAVSIAPPGKANSFYVKDAESGNTWQLKETRPQDYPAAAGVELVFDPFTSRDFDLIEGNDTSESAWHFRNVKVGPRALSPDETTLVTDTEDGNIAAEVYTLAEASKWISRNARKGGNYTIVVRADQTAENLSFGYGGKKVTVILSGADSGWTITRIGNPERPIITVKGKETTFVLEDGITLSGAGLSEAVSLVVVDTGAFKMNGGIITGGENRGVYVDKKGTFIMNGGVITGNQSYSGGGVYSNGTFTMTGGVISGNTAGHLGGGVYFANSTFNMTGGVISGNTATAQGGGVYGDIRKSGGFSKSGGIVYGSDAPEAQSNKALAQGATNNWGHAIFISHGKKTMHHTGFDKTANERNEMSSKDYYSGWEWDFHF